MALNSENLMKHTEAVLLLEQIVNEIKGDNINLQLFHINIKIKRNLNIFSYYDTLNEILKIIKRYEKIERKENGNIKKCNKYKFIKKIYNSKINKLHFMIRENSMLQNIHFLNNALQLVPKVDQKNKDKTDILTLEKFNPNNIGPSNIILKLSQGRIFCEDANYLLNCLINYIEKTDTNCLIVSNVNNKKNNLWGCVTAKIDNIDHYFKLTICFPQSSTMKSNSMIQYSSINSDSTKILHHLCNGYIDPNCYEYSNMSSIQIITYEKYFTYQCAVRKRIYQLIRNLHNDNTFNYQIIDCLRTYPKPCNLINIIKKNINGYLKKCSKNFQCSCGMEMCIGGCCRIYHGENDCALTFDEASEQTLKIIAENCSCPKCLAPVEKNSGCNHMTCICKTEFCFVCKKEFKKDQYNRYMINEHYSDNGVGIMYGATCLQY